MKVDFTKFEGSLPYSSELFGVYQPLLGWKSRRIRLRFRRVRESFRRELISYIQAKIFPDVQFQIRDERELEIERLSVGRLALKQRSGVSPQIDSLVARAVLSQVQQLNGLDEESVWERVLSEDGLNGILTEVQRTLLTNPSIALGARAQKSASAARQEISAQASIEQLASHESVVAGTLHVLAKKKQYQVLHELFFPQQAEVDLTAFFDMKAFIDPLETFDPKTDLDLVALSPIGIIHLFRQYFFEFDTFLGTPVQHIWLSPHGTVELIEISTRKIITERVLEASTDTVVKTEKSLTEEDEISDAVRDENTNDTKFGVSANAEAGVNLGVFTAHASVSTNYGFGSNEKKAREQLHKQNRQQTSKLAAEIKKNYKTTFRTVTETQDSTSKRYVLLNNTDNLANYELRRKMRQVGVQIQDIGTQLCWQTYVDVPGNALGVAKLVHIAEPADLANIPQPQAPVRLEPKTVEVVVPFAYENTSGSDEKDVTFYQGSDEESSPDHNDTIIWIRSYQADPPDHGYTLDPNISLLPQHSSTCAAEPRLLDPAGKYEIRLNQVNFDDQSQINIKVTLRWNAPDQSAAEAKFLADQEKYAQEKERLTKEAYVKAARDRIKLASNIEPRPSMDLREEERIIVYRKLIGQLLNVGVNLENSQTRHITAELISSLFDVDKMLYFVAPEWWRPHLHDAHQTFGSANADGVATSTTHITQENIVSWGGANEWRPDNYYITEDSQPAKLGSSLGWLLQLDGDALRNAFLNAPWVKAVIPIRPGKELAALNWLTHASVEGTDGLDAKYQAASNEEAAAIAAALKAHTWASADDQARYGAAFAPADITLFDALKYLAVVVAEKSAQANEKKETVLGGELKSYLPTDLVYEHGFYPLPGGFKAQGSEPFEVFDQWIEVLPTDQIVAVEVKYDPKTGMQID